MTYEEIRKKYIKTTDESNISNTTPQSSYEALRKKYVTGPHLTPGVNVDTNYINSFLNDSQKFSSDVLAASEQVGYKNANSYFEDYKSRNDDLRSRAKNIKAYLYDNRSKLDEDKYNQFIADLDKTIASQQSAVDWFAGKVGDYKKYSSEEEYNAAVKAIENRQVALNLDTVAAEKELKDLNELYILNDGVYDNQYHYNNMTYSDMWEKYRDAGYSRDEATKLAVAEYHEYVDNLKSRVIDTLKGYEGYDGGIGLRNAIDEKTQLLNQAKKVQEINNITQSIEDLYNKYSINGDWVEQSKYTKTYDGDVYGWDDIFDKSTDGDYDAVNNWAYAGISATGGNNDEYYSMQMTDKEKQLFNYIYHTQGRDVAFEWHNSIVPLLKARLDEKVHENTVAFAENYPVLSDITSVATSLLSGAEFLVDAGASLFTGEMDENQLAKATSTIRGTRTEQVDWEIGNWDAFDFLYNSGMSMADSLTAGVALGPLAGVSLGASAAAQGVNDALERGMNSTQAFWNGLATGVFEGLFESISLGKFNALKEVAPKTFKDVVKNVGKSMLVNASEETLTEIANIMYDTLVNGEYANYTFDDLKNGNTWKKIAGQIAEAAGSGALMGIGFGGAGSAIGYHNNNKAIKDTYGSTVEKMQSLVTQGLSMPVNSKAYELAQKYQAQLNDGKKLSGAKLSRLANEVNALKMKAVVQTKLTGLGETGDVSKIADVIVKQVSGAAITRSEKTILQSSKYGQQVAKEVANMISGHPDWFKTDTTQTENANGTVENGFVGVNSNFSYTAEQADILSRMSTEAIQNAFDYYYQTDTDIPLNVLGIERGSDLYNSFKATGLLNANDTVNGMALIDERSRRRGESADRTVDSDVQNGYNDIGDIQNNSNSTVLSYEEEAALLAYKSSESYIINAKLRESIELGESEQAIVNGLDSGLEKLPTYRGKVYRNIQFDGLGDQAARDEFVAWHVVGDVVRYPAYISASTDIDGYPLEGDFVVCFEIESTNGRNIEGYGNNFESEVLFSRGARFIVNDIKYDANGTPTIYLTEVQDNESSGVSGQEDSGDFSGNNRGQQKASSESGASEVQRLSTQDSNDGEMQSSVSKRNTERDFGGKSELQGVQAEGDENLKSNSGVSEADSNESASFMPESESVFEEPSTNNPKFDLTEEIGAQMAGVKRLTDEQRTIVKIGKALGYEVEFGYAYTPDGKMANGKIDYDNKKIILNPNVKKPIQWILKHELTHFGEQDADGYKAFVEAVKKSDIFKQWLQEKTGLKDATVDSMLAELNNKTRNEREAAGDPMGPAEAQTEIIADFSGDVLFSKNENGVDALLKGVEQSRKPKIIQFICDFLSYLKDKLSGVKNVSFELQRLESKYLAMLKMAQKNTTEKSGVKYAIITLDSGKSYVKASRQVIHGNSVAEWRSQISGFFNESLKNGPIEIQTVEGDVLTISKETANKARDKHISENGVSRELTDNEFLVKLHAESHIDELTEISVSQKDVAGNKKVVPDQKNHDIAHDGFSYRTVYFQDFDGSYYRITLSVGESDDISTVYNVGKIKTDNIPNGNIVSAIGSKADMLSAKHSIPTSSENVKYSISEDSKQSTDYTAEFDKLSEQFERGDITRADFVEQVKALYNAAGEEYGTIPKGETVTGDENYDDPTPKSVDGKKNVSRHVRTIIEGGSLTEEMLDITRQQILSGDLSYTPTSNEGNLKYAKRAIESGRAESMWQMAANGEEKPSANAVAVGEMLLKLAVERKDTARVVQLTAELSEMATRLGQATQAFSLLKRMDGIGQLYYVQKTVDRLNQDLQKKRGSKAPIVTINEALAQQLADSKTKADFDISYGAIMNDIASQVPATFLDKWNAWRYMSMLFNPTTHVRNVVGNAIFCPAIKVKDTLAVGLENVFVKEENRTKSMVIKKEYKDFASDDFENVQEVITGGGKMNPQRSIADNKPIFKNKVLENVRKFNFDMLEKEDAIFLKGHYIRALGGFLQARNVDLKNVSPDTLAKAREYAILEAQKATYRDISALANVFSNFANKNAFTNVMTEGVLPFKKTPINIIKRGIEYSPFGLLKTLSKGTYDLKNGNITASQYIDGIAGGLTGTGIVALGMLLSSLGVIKGGFGDDEEDWFNKMLGMQEYSIEIGGVSYTIDWAAPVCMPFFMGVTVMESFKEEGNADVFSSVVGALGAGLEPFINLSMLSGIQDTIATARYAEADEIIQSVALNIVDSYFSQMLPTIGGKINNLIDPMRRSNYIDKTSSVPEFVQSALNTLYSKVPGLSKYKAEYVDAWGEKQHKGNFVERFFQSFLSPGYASDVEVTEIDAEIKRLAKETGESSVFPDTAQKCIKFKGVTKYLTADEYEIYAVNKGQLSADYINELMHNEVYRKLTDEQRVKVIEKLYKFANAKAKAKLSYSYDEINAMHGGVISREKFNSYSRNVKKALVEEYFFADFKKVIIKEKNGGSAVDYFIQSVKNQ